MKNASHCLLKRMLKSRNGRSLSITAISAIAIAMNVASPAFAADKTVTNFNPGHYIYTTQGITERMKDLLEAPGSPFLGVQKTYEWSAIEPVDNGPLNLEEMRADMAYLGSKGKFLVAQIMIKDFNANAGSTVYPAWLRTKNGSPKSGGGFYKCFFIDERADHKHDMDTSKSLPTMWDPVTAYYVKRFYHKLGTRLSTMPEARKALEAVNLNETAMAANLAELDRQSGLGIIKPFDQEAYIKNIVDCANTLNLSLSNAIVIQYVNHSGPWSSSPNLATNRMNEFVTRLAAKGIGVGCPDLISKLVSVPNAHEVVYPALRPYRGKVIMGIASQPRGYHKFTGDVSEFVQSTFDLGRKRDGTAKTADSLDLNYIFWTRVPDNLDTIRSMLNRPGSPWASQKHRGLVGTPPASLNVFKP